MYVGSHWFEHLYTRASSHFVPLVSFKFNFPANCELFIFSNDQKIVFWFVPITLYSIYIFIIHLLNMYVIEIWSNWKIQSAVQQVMSHLLFVLVLV